MAKPAAKHDAAPATPPAGQGVSIDRDLQRLLRLMPAADPGQDLCRRTLARIRSARTAKSAAD